MKMITRIGNMFIKYMSLYLSMLIPKNKNKMVFGAWFGNKYADNTKYLYKYVVEECKEINAVWLTENKDVYNELQSKGYPVKCLIHGQVYGQLCALNTVLLLLVEEIWENMIQILWEIHIILIYGMVYH